MTIHFNTSAQTVTYDPFELFKNEYNRLGYLRATLKPYIAIDDPSEGILAKWSWNPEGTILSAVVSEQATWQDGTVATAKDIALSIAMGIRFRHLGEKVSVKGFDADIADPNWHEHDYSGIKIIGPSTFQLEFESDIDHLPAVIEESLSEEATYNFSWPKRLGSSDFDVIARHEITKENDRYSIKVGKHEVELETFDELDFSKPTIGLFMKVDNQYADDYHLINGRDQAVNTGIINTTKDIWQSTAHKTQLSSFIRSAIRHYQSPTIIPTDTMILEGELGYSDVAPWPRQAPTDFPVKKLKISTGYTIAKDPGSMYAVYNEQADKIGLELEWSSHSADNMDMDVDVLLIGGSVVNGRQSWLQDAFNLPLMGYLAEDKALVAVAKELMEASALTTAAAEQKIKAFEQTARETCSIFPIARFPMSSINKKNCGVEIAFTANGIPRLREVSQ